MISVTLMRTHFSEKEVKKIKENYAVNLVEKWKLLDFGIPKTLNTMSYTTELYEILADALTGYGISGHPDKETNIKAILEGKNGEYYYGTDDDKWNNNN